jgi:hypothetical protein
MHRASSGRVEVASVMSSSTVGSQHGRRESPPVQKDQRMVHEGYPSLEPSLGGQITRLVTFQSERGHAVRSIHPSGPQGSNQEGLHQQHLERTPSLRTQTEQGRTQSGINRTSIVLWTSMKTWLPTANKPFDPNESKKLHLSYLGLHW